MNDTSSKLKLDAFWPYQVVVLGDLISRHTLRILRDNSDLNLSQWRVLAAIGEQDGRSSAEVVAITPMDKGIVSRAVASLITAGYVSKAGDPGDKRRASLHLTASGKKLYRRLVKRQTAAIAELESEITTDINLNALLLERIAALSAKMEIKER